MTQRNPMNPRNQQGYTGVSRKSASSAKPAREAGASVYTRTAEARTKAEEQQRKQEQKEEERKQRRRQQALGAGVTQLPEYKKWRRVWIVCIVIAIICVAASWAINALENNDMMPASLQGASGAIAMVALIAGYVFIIACLFIDFKMIRPIRKKQENLVNAMTKKELKELDDLIENANKKKPADDAPAADKRSRGAKKGAAEDE